MTRAGLFIPLGVFLVLAVLLFSGFYLNDPHKLPSALIDKPFPAFELQDLTTGELKTEQALRGNVTLVNVWATWCPTCRAEHDMLNRLAAQEGLRIVGINYKDDPVAAQRWLLELGNPYDFSVVDRDGQVGVDLGVYGAPETFVVDTQGVIRYKHVGDVNPRIWRDVLEPVVRELRIRGEVAEPNSVGEAHNSTSAGGAGA